MKTLLLLLQVSAGSAGAGAVDLPKYTDCLRHINRFITTSTPAPVGRGYVFVTQSSPPTWRSNVDGVYVLTDHALHFYTDYFLAQEKCAYQKIERAGAHAITEHYIYENTQSKYGFVGINFDQSDLKRVRTQVAVDSRTNSKSRVLGWDPGALPKNCRLTGHQIMDPEGKWIKNLEEIVTAGLNEFYRLGSGVAKLTDDPNMILGPLKTCAKVPNSSIRNLARSLTNQFESPTETRTSPPTDTPAGK